METLHSRDVHPVQELLKLRPGQSYLLISVPGENKFMNKIKFYGERSYISVGKKKNG